MSVWTEFMVSVFIIVAVIWGWRNMKGGAGSWKPWTVVLLIVAALIPIGPCVKNSMDTNNTKVPTARQNNTPTGATASPVGVSPSKWVFSQVKGNGSHREYEVEVTACEPGILHGVIQKDEDGRKINLAGFKLSQSGDNWFGTWVNYKEDERGTMELYKQVPNVWAGHYTLPDKTTRICGLRLQMR
jgi:hypothetical protein